MKMTLNFKTLSSGRYYPDMSFYNIGHEILHSHFIYRSIGVTVKDGSVIKECRLKKCTEGVDTFTVRFSDNLVYTVFVSFGDNFAWKIQRMVKD